VRFAADQRFLIATGDRPEPGGETFRKRFASCREQDVGPFR